MIEFNTNLIGLSAYFARGETKARESLEKHSLEELFNLHGMLNIKSISYWYRKYHQKVNCLYHAGSFVVADTLIDIDKRVIQIHFIPFNSTRKSTNSVEIDEAMLLALTDAEAMFNIVERVHQEQGIKEILGQTKDMALIARRFGLDIRNHKINQYSNVISTTNIPLFLTHARKELQNINQKIPERFGQHNITIKNARINAILRFMGKVG